MNAHWIVLLPVCFYAGCAASAQANVAAPPSLPPPPEDVATSDAATVDPTSPPSAPAAQTPAQPPDDSYDDEDPAALQDFRPTLDAHGVWVDDPTYGTVWVPNAAEVGAKFTPYVSEGHWTYADANDGYLWESGYDWGWAPFHFGRWVEMASGGWAWVPGRQYGPAWVEWKTGDGYVGWAPAPPRYLWHGGVATAITFQPQVPYVFCADANLFSPTPPTVILTGPEAVAVEGRSHEYLADGAQGGSATGGGGGDYSRPHPGPPPVTLGIQLSFVTQPAAQDEGIARARAFARPSTAVGMGAQPPLRRAAASGFPRERPTPPAPAQVRVQPRREIPRPYPAAPPPPPERRAVPAPDREVPRPIRAAPAPDREAPRPSVRPLPPPPVRSQPALAPPPRQPARVPPKKRPPPQ